jgi:hypothetical protein
VHVQPGSSSKARGRDSVEQPQAVPLVERRTLCRKRSTADHLNPAIRKPVAASSSRVKWATASACSRQRRSGALASLFSGELLIACSIDHRTPHAGCSTLREKSSYPAPIRTPDTAPIDTMSVSMPLAR